MAQALAAAAGDAAETAVASYFEVHVQRDERWMIDCTAHNAEDALAEAEEIARKADVTAVKVINERYNAATDQSAARVVFKVEKRRRSPRSDGPRLMARPRAARAAPVTGQASSGPEEGADPPAAALSADHARSIPHPTLRPTGPVGLSLDLASRPGAAAGTWQLFAWASIGLAVAATLLFIILLLIT